MTQVLPIPLIVLMISTALGVPEPEIRPTRDKVRKRLVYAIRSGDLTEFGAQGSGLLFAPQVVAWAREKWPGFFRDHPADQSAVGGSTAQLSAVAIPWVIPGDLKRCQQALIEAERAIEKLAQELGQELADAHAEISYLRPLAKQYVKNRAKNRRSARLPRGGLT